MDLIYILGGFFGLIIGGSYLVSGAVALANRLGISPMIIGLTLVGFGTSMPELVTSVQAALIGSPGIAMGNVIGSNIANILLILGIGAILAPIAVTKSVMARDGSILVLATVLCVAIVLYGFIGRIAGLGLIAILVTYLVVTIRSDQSAPSSQVDEVMHLPSPLRSVLILVGGLATTIFAARFLVQGAVSVAAQWGMSETVIGLTVVAIGTSLPELMTTIIAARRGQNDVAFGNVIGSNIFNILGILGATAVISPLNVPVAIIRLDIWVMLAATTALVFFSMTGWRVSRRKGTVLLVGYGVYLAVLIAS